MARDITVEINMRLPNITVRSDAEPTRIIVNADVRFTTRIDLPALPRPGDLLDLSTTGGHRLPVKVTRVDWSEEKAVFVVGCQYAKKSVPLDTYTSLKSDLDWHEKPLL